MTETEFKNLSYYEPIVDHSTARIKAIEAFKKVSVKKLKKE